MEGKPSETERFHHQHNHHKEQRDGPEQEVSSNEDLDDSLYQAAHNGELDKVKQLISQGANVNYQKWYGWTPLYTASQEGHTGVVELLLQHNANPNISDKYGETPLYRASQEGHTGIVELLLQHNGDSNISDKYGRTPLYTASWKGHTGVVELLLQHNADSNISDEDGKTPLYFASWKGHTGVVELLLQHNADPNISDENDNTPIHVAASVPIVKLLTAHGASLEAVTTSGRSVLHTAAAMWGRVELIDYYISQGLLVNGVDNFGNTVLHCACEDGHSDVVLYLLRKGCSMETVNNDNLTPIDILKQPGPNKYSRQRCLDMLQSQNININPLPNSSRTGSDITDSDVTEPTEGTHISTDNPTNSNKDAVTPTPHTTTTSGATAKVSDHSFKKVDREMKEASGRMKVGRFVLHGAPQSGKSSARDLLVNKPPVKKESTRLVEDPVKAVSTRSVTTAQFVSYQSLLEEIDEEKMIGMIQRQVMKPARERKRRLPKRKSKIKSQAELHHPVPTGHSIPTNPLATTSSSPHSSPDQQHSSPPVTTTSDVLCDIASNLDSLDSNVPPLFHCHHLNIVDSGGQSEFSNLLPLLFRSQSHHHAVVIRLDTKLNDKPVNCVCINGTVHKLPGHLVLTNYQLIERVLQMAAGSKSHVVIIGTHLDVESKEESLAMKNELLKPLMAKYESNLVLNEEGNPIFAVNAMAPVGEERTRYALTLQQVMLIAPVLTEDGEEEEGMVVPLRWIVLELELNRRSKAMGVIERDNISNIAQVLGITNLADALAFFNELAVHYYYPEALPDKVFTSITPISSRLSDIVEATFIHKFAPKSANHKKLQTTGQLSRSFLEELCSKLPRDDIFSIKDFVSILKYLRVLYAVDDDTFLIPSLLPIETKPIECNYHQPLLCYWIHDGEVRILPQSYYHALIVELLRREQFALNIQAQHSRSAFNFVVTMRVGDALNKCRVLLVDHVFWVAMLVEGFTKREHCLQLLDILQSCTMRVLEQLKLTHLGELQRGLSCYCDNGPHPSECTDLVQGVFACMTTGHVWKEENSERLFWFKAPCASTSVSSHSRPFAKKVFDVFKDKSAQWDSFGHELNVSINYRQELLMMPIGVSADSKLDLVIQKWVESECSPVNWSTVRQVLTELDMKSLLSLVPAEDHTQ